MPLPIPLVPIPLKTDRPVRRMPYVTYALVAFNILTFLVFELTPEQRNFVTQNWGFVINDPSLLTLFTHAFLHAHLMHLIGNMLLLWVVGTVLEVGIGSAVFALLYAASIVVAVILNGLVGRLFSPESLNIPLIGASGAISGVLGLAVFRYYRMSVRTLLIVFVYVIPVPIPRLIWLPYWMYAIYFAGQEIYYGLVQLFSRDGQYDLTAHWAHIGGLVLGALLACVLRSVEEGRREYLLEDARKALDRGVPPPMTVMRLERMLWDYPHDPELLEMMATLRVARREMDRARDSYQRAILRYLVTGSPRRAAESYLRMLQAFPDARFAPREQMALAKALELDGQFQAAAWTYAQVACHYPEHDDAQTALLRASLIYQRHLQDPATARALLQSLLQRYPDSTWCTLARQRLQELV